MCDNWPSNRIFQSYDDIVALSCEAWNKLIERPWKTPHRHGPMGTWVLINTSWYEAEYPRTA